MTNAWQNITSHAILGEIRYYVLAGKDITGDIRTKIINEIYQDKQLAYSDANTAEINSWISSAIEVFKQEATAYKDGVADYGTAKTYWGKDNVAARIKCIYAEM